MGCCDCKATRRRDLSSVGFAIAVILAAVAGCQDPNRVATYSASGTIRYADEAAVEAGSILFLPSDGQPPARGMIKNGQFRLSTYEEEDGAAAGKFQVAVLVAPPMDFDPDAGRAPPTADLKYARPETSGLRYEITADGENHFQIVLERAK